MSGQGKCPGCGAPITFRVTTSVVAVCGFCQQVVARGGVDLEDLGKSNPVLVVPSAFVVGTVGRFRDQGFTVVGRAQLKHALGGMWNEWYAALDNGRWVWIAEHQGRAAFMGEVSPTQAPGIRALDAATPGSRWLSGRGEFVVVERGIATVYAEEGELPWRAAPNERRAAVDLQGPGGVFATLDFGAVGADEQPQGPTRFFVGHEVDVASLALSHPTGGPTDAEAALPQVEGSVALACPNCQAPLALRRPADSRTIVCESCGSASSIDEHKKLALLFAQKLRFDPKIPLGARARFDEKLLANARAQDDLKSLDVEVVAFVVRSVVEDGQTFTFEEYLLATPKRGFFWLVESDAQWYLYQPISAADVTEASIRANYKGLRFLLEGHSTPKVEQVMGELYWQVELGDMSQATDYFGKKYRLTVEKTKDEVNWTFGFLVSRSELSRTFGVALPISTSSSFGGSPFASSTDSSARDASREELPTWAWVLIVIFFLFLIVSDCTGGGGGGGGGHGSYGGGGGISFGK
jgi:ribosomal protein L37AE/L43A